MDFGGENLAISSINPLQIDLILKDVLSHLPLSSLKKFRLVNRDWNSKSVQWMRKNKMLQKILIKSEYFQRFCAVFEKCELLPFYGMCFVLEGMHLDLTDQFFSRHGSFVLDLHIIELTNRSNSYEEKKARRNLMSLQQIFPKVPNLNILRLCLDYIPQFLSENIILDSTKLEQVRLKQLEVLSIQTTKIMCRNFLETLFLAIPNVKYLTFEGIQPSLDQSEALFLAMNKIRFRRVISLAGVTEGVGLWSAISRTQKLHGLGIYLESGVIQTPDLVSAQYNLLRSQSENLEELCISNGMYREDAINNGNIPKLVLPIMTNTKTIFFYQTNYVGQDPKSVQFNIASVEPRQLPNVSLFCITETCLLSGVVADFPFNTVTELHVLRRCGEDDERLEILSKITSRFPNIRKLGGLRLPSLGSTEMNLIASSWPNLEDLNLSIWNESVQQDFNRVVSGILEGDASLEGRLGLASFLPFSHPLGSSLRDLKKLKQMVLKFNARDRKEFFHIDEIGVYRTFLRLSPSLRLYFEGDFLIADDLASVLKLHYRNIFIKRSDRWMYMPSVS